MARMDVWNVIRMPDPSHYDTRDVCANGRLHSLYQRRQREMADITVVRVARQWCLDMLPGCVAHVVKVKSLHDMHRHQREYQQPCNKCRFIFIMRHYPYTMAQSYE